MPLSFFPRGLLSGVPIHSIWTHKHLHLHSCCPAIAGQMWEGVRWVYGSFTPRAPTCILEAVVVNSNQKGLRQIRERAFLSKWSREKRQVTSGTYLRWEGQWRLKPDSQVYPMNFLAPVPNSVLLEVRTAQIYFENLSRELQCYSRLMPTRYQPGMKVWESLVLDFSCSVSAICKQPEPHSFIWKMGQTNLTKESAEPMQMKCLSQSKNSTNAGFSAVLKASSFLGSQEEVAHDTQEWALGPHVTRSAQTQVWCWLSSERKEWKRKWV
jgi:hypothetical protein